MRKTKPIGRLLCLMLVFSFMFAARLLAQDASPSIFSSSYGEKWMHVVINSNQGHHAARVDDNVLKTQTANLTDPNQEWCFVGDADGFYAYNRAAGADKVVTTSSQNGGGTLSLAALAEGNALQIWTLKGNGSTYAITPKNNAGQSWNPYGGVGGQLKLYGAGDANSRWIFKLADAPSSYADRDNNLIEDGGVYTFISALEAYYTRQKVQKAMYLNTSDGKLYWKNYDPSDDAFYFKAHVNYGTVTMECVAKPGFYLVSPTGAVAEQGTAFTITRFESGDCNIVMGGGTFHTNGHGGGGGNASNIVSWGGGTNTASAWFIQRADSKETEVARYQQELADRQAAADEADRQAARAALKAAIDATDIGTAVGQHTQEAVDAATEVYDNETLTTADYSNALEALAQGVNMPAVGSYYKMINAATTWTGEQARVMSVGSKKVQRWETQKESLYQIWQVANQSTETPSCIAFRNMGSGTYMKADSRSNPTTTNGDEIFMRLYNVSGASFNIQRLASDGKYYNLTVGGHGNGAGIEGNLLMGNDDYSTWTLVEVSDEEVGGLSYAEDDRIKTRSELLDYINNVKAQTTALGAIGYYNTLNGAIAAAQAIYDDETNSRQEYEDARLALQTAYDDAAVIAPDAAATYTVTLTDGLKALEMMSGKAVLSTIDDTKTEQFWTLTHNGGSSYTLGNGGDEVNITLTRAGNDSYAIEGYEGLFHIRSGSVAADHGYLTSGIYRIVNVATGKALSNNGTLVARTLMADIDETATDHLQLWTVEKLAGADRYTLHNVETTRYLDQIVMLNSKIGTSTHHAAWHLVEGETAGQYQLVTTEGIAGQACAVGTGSEPVIGTIGTEGCMWTFEQVTPQEKPVVSYPAVRIKNYGNTYYISAVERVVEQKAPESVDECGEKAMWIILPHEFTTAEGTETRYAIRNAYSGLYMQDIAKGGDLVGAGTSPVYFRRTEGNQAEGTYMFKSPTSSNFLNAHGNKTYLIGYGGETDRNSHWYIEDVPERMFTEDELMVKADAYEGFVAPSDGLICRIYNPYNNSYMDEDYKTMSPRVQGLNKTKHSQLWRMHYDEEEAMYTLENLYTGHFIKNQANFNAAYRMAESESEAGTFTVALNPSFVGRRIYNIIDSKGGKYAHHQGGGALVTWNASTNGTETASEWRFTPVEVSEEEIEAMRTKFYEMKHMTDHVDEYAEILSTLFADNACTTLREGISDEEWSEAMSNLPDMLSEMCEKIKNDTWPVSTNGRNWEKAFRIADYAVVSSPSIAGNEFKLGFGFSQLNDPMGISVQTGEVVAIMVENLPSADATLTLEHVVGFSRTGTQHKLNQGLNLIQIPEESNLFIRYMVNRSGDDERYYLDKFPDIKIHIEGGTVIGYLDRTRDFTVEKVTTEGMVKTAEPYTYKTTTRAGGNEMWADLQADGLISNGYMSQIKSRNIYFHFNSKSVLDACPTYISEVTDIWDYILDVSWWLMGWNTLPESTREEHKPQLINTYFSNLDKRFNGRWIAAERDGGYMNANGGGAQYNTGTIGTIMNFDAMKAGGAHWGPAHEYGHDHQSPINMCGMTEVSNNLFSNVVTWEFGRQMSRGESMSKMTGVYAAGGHWYDLGIWAQTQMYYKLYLYYHVAGNMPDFYQKVYDRMRKEPLLRRVGSAVPVDRDFLHFALVCCEVAGEDLSEFFEAYGMFRDITPENCVTGATFEEKVDPDNGNTYLCRVLPDYSTYHMYSTPEMLAAVKAKMQACGPRNGNIVFIDDRFPTPAKNEWAAEGEMRGPRDLRAGTQGDMGNVTDFTPEAQAQGTAVGHKVYDAEGNLLYFTTKSNYTVPENVIEAAGGEENLVVAEAMADGTTVEQANEEDKIYSITTYQHDANGLPVETTFPSTGRLKPILSLNDVAVVRIADGKEGNVEDYPFAETPNVIVNDNMSELNITDMHNLTLPDGTTATTVRYSRAVAAEWNSVCLPFAVEASDFGEGCKIYTLKTYSQGDETSVIMMKEVGSVEAGEPCYVWCPESVTSWNIEKTVNGTVTTAVSKATSDDGTMWINGSFTNKAIGEGKYKLNSSGTAFGVTSAAGKAAAFRSYIETENTSNVRRFILCVDNATAIGDINAELEPDVMYDLSGRRITQSVKGQPYIINGKVRIEK